MSFNSVAPIRWMSFVLSLAYRVLCSVVYICAAAATLIMTFDTAYGCHKLILAFIFATRTLSKYI
jgi:hypothetical protein